MGFIVNPIAGMGGKVGLKGTDGVLEEAIARGAKPIAPKRAIEFLHRLKKNFGDKQIEVLACPGIMGANEAKTASLIVHILPMKIGRETSAEDTKKAVKLLTAANVNLIVFVGGDGTAKDIFDAMRGNDKIPVLGVPSGVKMYSGIFAVNTSDAADVVLAFAEDQVEQAEFEVMDADENAIRSDTFAVKLYGFLKGPFLPAHIQGSKQISPETTSEKENQTAIARFIIEGMQPTATYILGPGTTVKCIAELLGIKKTVLGVDIYKEGKVILDVDEKKIQNEIEDWQNVWIILSPIGRQGILLGRGNQQISPEIIKRVGKQRIIVAATKNKLQSIEGSVLRVDTGDAEADNMLRGYIRVITDYKEWRLMLIK
ncbi:ATP-NAD kinase family protein [Candidatus Bathyarchaeota archaeon]|nr:ATP-NAD kinase family protein [Candidatus Bathyarchaeota archaeon]